MDALFTRVTSAHSDPPSRNVPGGFLVIAVTFLVTGADFIPRKLTQRKGKGYPGPNELSFFVLRSFVLSLNYDDYYLKKTKILSTSQTDRTM